MMRVWGTGWPCRRPGGWTEVRGKRPGSPVLGEDGGVGSEELCGWKHKQELVGTQGSRTA